MIMMMMMINSARVSVSSLFRNNVHVADTKQYLDH